MIEVGAALVAMGLFMLGLPAWAAIAVLFFLIAWGEYVRAR